MKNYRIILLLILLVPLSIFLGSAQAGAAQDPSTDSPIATLRVTGETLTWVPSQTFDGMLLEISLPDGRVDRIHAGPNESATLAVSTSEHRLPDGTYSFQLSAFPQIDEATLKMLASIQDSMDRELIIAEMQATGQLPAPPPAMTGDFIVQDGAFILGSGQPGEEEPDPPPGDQLFDIIHADDVIINGGSLCVGFDCVNGENFGSDTIRLKENNLRVHFDDTSTSASFPDNDWRFIINDSSNGGGEYFALEDSSAGRQVFRVDAGAASNSLYVDSQGDVGLGTTTPVLELSLKAGDSPGIRFEQDGTNGWTPQTWDVAGNETNFYIRDATNGSALPFRIRSSAPTNSLYIDQDGNVGLGTSSPSHALEVAGSSTVSGDGNVLVDGYVTELSSVHAKQNFSSIDPTAVLDALAQLEIQTWSYRTESSEIIHMGPTAQDFYAAFQLGKDDEHIASIDSNGVALAAIQGLHQNLVESHAEIAALEAQNADLENRLSRLEAVYQSGNPTAPIQPAWFAIQFVGFVILFFAGLMFGRRWRGVAQNVD